MFENNSVTVFNISQAIAFVTRTLLVIACNFFSFKEVIWLTIESFYIGVQYYHWK